MLRTSEVDLLPNGEVVSVEVDVHNKSEIVDSYIADFVDAPPWLDLSAERVRLMPDTGSPIQLTLRIRDGILPAAQRIPVSLRVRSELDARRASVLTLIVRSPEVRRPIGLRAEPSVIRVKDDTVGQFLVVADNSASNHAVRLELRGRDPEQVVTVIFERSTLDVAAGEVATTRARLEAPLPEAGGEASRAITVAADDGRRTVEASLTFVQRASVLVPDPPVRLRLHPSLVSVVDAAVGELRVEIDNSHGRRETRVQLRGDDPEGIVRFEFLPGTIDIGPGAAAAAAVRLAATQPPNGLEVTRPFTITARHDTHSVDTTGAFRQRTSAVAITAIRLRVDPPSLRVHDAVRGRVRVIADNRSGTQATRIRLYGTDHEGTGTISFSTPYVDVHPGQQATVDAEIRAPRPPAGTEHSRRFTITATDGSNEIAAEAVFTQTASDRKPRWRTLSTLLGGFVMILGAFLTWTMDPDRHSGVHWSISELARLYDKTGPALNPTLARLASAGTVIIVLALLAVWGRLGPKGRLTRFSALLGIVLIVGFVILVRVRRGDGGPDVGAFLVVLGCLSAYVGGHLAKR